MSRHDPTLDTQKLDKLSDSAGMLGYEIVDIAGFFDRLSVIANDQTTQLSTLQDRSQEVTHASSSVFRASEHLGAANAQSTEIVATTVKSIQSANASSQNVATWVHELSQKTGDVDESLGVMRSNNQQIVAIARQVNTLAINAKIEAARAGELGLGFSVVADAINDLSQQTRKAATQISESVDGLGEWIMNLAREAQEISEHAAHVLDAAEKNNIGLGEMQTSIASSQKQVASIVSEAQKMRSAMTDFGPYLNSLKGAVNETSSGIQKAHDRVNKLIDTSEQLVQYTAAIGATSSDAKFITFAQSAAAEISNIFTQAVASGQISQSDLFDESYQPIPGSDPQQVTTRFTVFTDRVLPRVQEPALEMDPKVVFCAAIDKNGYIPTHNNKFSQPLSKDPEWNAANCRNRRMFNDRVGLKAGRNTAPFLQQTYRRDMGGGNFVMMKDISAPIFVGDKHWGGLRFAVKY